MQVPEKLALIGGSILLSSTLIFTLKSQASSIIPHVGHSISNVYQDITNTNAEHGALSFDDAFKNAQKQHWQTGTWGSSKYYIDNNENMHIGQGKLDKPIYDVLGDDVHQIKTINLDENIQAPDDSDSLFAGNDYHKGPDADTNTSITQINGLNRLDVSHTNVVSDMFYRDLNLSSSMDLDNWDTSKVINMRGMFGNTNVPSFNINNWNVKQDVDTSWMFYNDYNLGHLNLSGWHMDNPQYTNNTFAGDMNLNDLSITNFRLGSNDTHDFFGNNGSDYGGPVHSLQRLTLGNDTHFDHLSYFPAGTWQNGGQTLNASQLNDDNAHPGTWVK